MNRCHWVNLDNPLYIKYHDEEWCVPSFDDHYLFEMLILEMFQAGLSWECVLNKREAFKIAYDNFDVRKVANYKEDKVKELMNNALIIRNLRKIKASIINAQVFIEIQKEYGSFSKYMWSFTNQEIIVSLDDTIISSSPLSDIISKDLKDRGMKFVGTTIIYSYLQAIGIVNDHEKDCFLKMKKGNEK